MASVAIAPSAQKINFACPKCQTKYQVSASLLGKRASCRKCDNVMQVRPAPRPVAKVNSPSRPVNPPVQSTSSTSSPNFKSAGLGLILKATGDIITIASLAIVFPIALFVDTTVMAYAFMTLMVAGGLSSLIGIGLCFTIPKQTKARNCLYLTVACSIASTILVYLGIGLGSVYTLGVIGFGFVFFMLFLKRTALNTGRVDLSKTARNILIIQFIVSPVSFILAFVSMIPGWGLAFIALHLGIINMFVLAGNGIACTVLQMQLGIHLRKK